MKELALLHDKHMNRPTLDDSSEEEHAIEITTQEITQVIHFTDQNLNSSVSYKILVETVVEGWGSLSSLAKLVENIFRDAISSCVSTADVSPLPASCDGFAGSLWSLHRAGGATPEERGGVSGTESAGTLHQFQTHTVWLSKT